MPASNNRIFALLVSIVAVSSDPSHQNATNEPLCSLPNLPFESEADVYDFQLNHTKCWHEYMKCENRAKYGGANGFKMIFGDDGYFLNKSSISACDGKEMKGHGAISAKTRFSRNMICINQEFDPSTFSINITEWGPYNHSFWGETTYVFSIPAFNGSEITVRGLVKTVYFEDGSGVIKYSETQSNGGKFGQVISLFVDTAQSIAEILEFEDEMVDNHGSFLYKLFGENINPIMIIFLMVICAFTLCIATAICILFVFHKKRTKSYDNVSLTDISTDDDVGIENRKKKISSSKYH